MIVSKSRSFIFFAVPKTGTHSVREALRAHMGPDDLEQVGLFVQRRFPFPEFAKITHGHISAREIRPVLGEQEYRRSFKFAFVRNPFDRFISYCAFRTRNTDHFKTHPLDVMRYVIHNVPPLNELLFRPQYTFLVDEQGQLDMDYVGRNESMQQSYDHICAHVGMPTAQLEKRNSTSRRPYQEYYTPELVARVGDYYAKDLELFNYRFD